MISFADPLAAGRAVRLIVSPPPGAVRWRVLRRVSDSFTGPDDPGALLVSDGQDHCIIDLTGLENGRPYYYRDYAQVGAGWIASETVAVTPAYSAAAYGPDPLSLVRERLDGGLQAELAAGRLAHVENRIEVLTAPPLWERTVFPVVTVQLIEDRAVEWGIGADYPDTYLAPDWREYDGWIAGCNLQITGWSLNPDERIGLRQALQRIVAANLPILASQGLANIDFSLRDAEDFEAYEAPVYFSHITLSAQYFALAGHTVDEISEVEAEGNYDVVLNP